MPKRVPPKGQVTKTMTIFDDVFQDVVDPVLFEQAGENFTYIPKVGEPRTVTGTIINSPKVHHENIGSRKRRVKTVSILFTRSGTTGLTNPQPGDKFEQASDTRSPKVRLMFRDVLEQDAAGITVELVESGRDVTAGNPSGRNQ